MTKNMKDATCEYLAVHTVSAKKLNLCSNHDHQQVPGGPTPGMSSEASIGNDVAPLHWQLLCMVECLRKAMPMTMCGLPSDGGKRARPLMGISVVEVNTGS